mmetsp:Transcript_47648/g.103714  ORF Transcript_47648/g.103714 Transcript_47648/m.103714 type:complete len:215 (-) Transcript_47648:27-671(-)
MGLVGRRCRSLLNRKLVTARFLGLNKSLQLRLAMPIHRIAVQKCGHSTDQTVHRCGLQLHEPMGQLLLDGLQRTLQCVDGFHRLLISLCKVLVLSLSHGGGLLQVSVVLRDGRRQLLDLSLGGGDVRLGLLKSRLERLLSLRRVLQLVLLLLGVLLAPARELLILLLFLLSLRSDLTLERRQQLDHLADWARGTCGTDEQSGDGNTHCLGSNSG